MTTTVRNLENFVGGEWLAPSAEGEDVVLDPSTEGELARAPRSSPGDVDRAVAAARAALGPWSARPPGERALALLRLADTVEAHADELAAIESADAGKPLASVIEDELPAAADQLRFFAGAARCLEGKAAGEYLEGYTSFVRREAVGVVAQITPWNYPLMMASGRSGPRWPPATRSSSSRPRPRRCPRCGWPSSRPSICRPACSTSSSDPATPPARRSCTTTTST